MKTKQRSKARVRPFELKIFPGADYYYLVRLKQLERRLARKPSKLVVEILGSGEIPPDTALVFRSVLTARSSRTRLVVRSRSSLQGSTALLWLMGEERWIREDAKMYFRSALWTSKYEVGLNDTGTPPPLDFEEPFTTLSAEDGDYARVLELIDEYLPVREFAGRWIGTSVLKQFGLIENASVDGFLKGVFLPSKGILQRANLGGAETP